MAGKRIAVVDSDGQFGTIDEEYAHEIESSGGRILGQKEIAQRAVDERYDALPTAQKALGAVTTAVGALTGNPIAFGADPAAPPTVAAYGAGVRQGLTAGLHDAGMRKLVDAVGGKEAGEKYAAQRDQEEAASPVATGAGNVVGMLGGAALGSAGGAARALPSAGIAAGGELLENATIRALGGVAGKSALRRAAVTGAGMAVRGALEGAAYAGIEQAASDVVHDTPTTGQKLYTAMSHGLLTGGTLGGALGFGGSLAGSAVRGIGRSVARQLEGGLTEAAARGGKASDGLRGLLDDPGNAVRKFANEQALDSIARGNGLQSTRFAKQVERAGGKAAVGETGVRYGLIDTGLPTDTPLHAAFKAGKSGTPQEILPKVEIALEQVGRKLGDITDSSGARVTREQVMGAIDRVAKEYESTAATRPVGRSLRAFGDDLIDSMGLHAEGSSARVQDALRERKGIDRIAFRDQATMDPKTALEAKRSLRWSIEDMITDALDEASGRVPGQLRDEYKALKRDFYHLSIWEDLAKDSAARSNKGALFGMRDTMLAAGAIASGNVAAAPVLALGGKVLRERGQAALAGYLTRAADRGTFNEMIRRLDTRVSKAAAGVLREANDGSPVNARRAAKSGAPRRRPDPETGRAQVEATQKQARQVVKWVGETKANPRRTMEKLEEAADIVAKTAGPKAAESYTATTLRAIAFVSSFVPVKERRDPLDPRSVPPLTYEEADRLVRAAKYAARPETIFDDFERGRVTPEGLRAAREFAPDVFMQFQMDLQQHVENHMLRNKRLTDSQRLRIDKLLGYPAGADLKPAAIARLQSNLMPAPPEPPPADPTQANNAPVNLKIQQSGFDAVEARVAG